MDIVTEVPRTHEYTHVVQYYETDAMRVVHHSNYIRWMEECRLDYMAEIGLAYDRMEKQGIIVPVISASCEYRTATRYGESVKIISEMERFDGLRFFVSYRVTDPDGGVLHATGSTGHCFLNRDMKPVNIKKTAPAIYEVFKTFR
ncbi:MAG: acyl-CoA thioesterase [Lachnospiraceae bacterium]|nr:acyl-CoA thioesterase [Lachnospiraceae bacterium]